MPLPPSSPRGEDPHPSGSPARRQSSVTTSKPRLKMNSNLDVRPRTPSQTSAPSSRRSSSLSRAEPRPHHQDHSKPSDHSEPYLKVIEKLEALTVKHESLLTRHETLMSRCETLESQHGNLIIKHSEVLDVLNKLIAKATTSMSSEYSSSSQAPLFIQKVPDSSPSIKPQASPSLQKHSSWSIKQPNHTVTNSPSRRQSVAEKREIKSPSRNTHRKTNNHTPGSDHGLRVCIRKRPAREDESDCVECVENQVT